MRSRRLFALPLMAAAFLAPAAAPAATSPLHPSASTHTAHTSHPVTRHIAIRKILRVAPADEYFGRMKMSILGIGNELRDLNARAQFTPDKSADVLGTARFVEDSMHDWEHKYPSDPWLAKDVFALTQLYAAVHTPEGTRCESRTLHWLLGRYGRSKYASLAKTQIVTTTMK